MLNLIAISYHNIGPFKDKKISIFFDNGNYLIKAPIGAGKSFLFFDGPSYALYKNGKRNLLNTQSKEGYIKLLFSIDGSYYLIVRQLKKGKVRDATSSELYSIENRTELTALKNNTEILKENLDIQALLENKNLKLEPIIFKNETDLQQQLNSLLPPQEVFMSTIVLLQDADNIFELTPAERLEVLKHIFGLLGIDESKEIIREKRNEIKYQIKAYQDSSQQEIKFKKLIQQSIAQFSQLQNFPKIAPLLGIIEQEIEEWEQLQDKLSIQNFTIDESFFLTIEHIGKGGEEWIKDIESLKTQRTTVSKEKIRISTKQEALKKEGLKVEKNIEEQERLLKEINTEKLQSLREQKEQLYTQQTELEQSIPSDELSKHYALHHAELDLSIRSDFGPGGAHQYMQELIYRGKTLKQEEDLAIKKKNQIEEEKEKKILHYQENLKHLKERKAFFATQIINQQKRIDLYQEQSASEMFFSCEKIGEPCPFVHLINKQQTKKNQLQKAELNRELEHLKLQNSQQNFEEQEKEINENLITLQKEFPLLLKNIDEQIEKNKKQIMHLKSFLNTVDYKSIEEKSQKRERIGQKQRTLDKQIQIQEELAANKGKYEQEKAVLIERGKQIQQEITLLKQERATTENNEQGIKTKLDQLQETSYQHFKSEYESFKYGIHQLSSLIEERNTQQLKVKEFIEKEKKLGNLYTIFSKELLLFVLSEYLPIISEILNSYLSSVVDYSISIHLKETNEKLELETKIIDSKGERDVKSLSGGQRVILKLVWMLAISSYLKTQLLFLDETVNNLDQETIEKVAELLTNFVKQRQIKFYLITHNSEIQTMNIWDQIINLEIALNS